MEEDTLRAGVGHIREGLLMLQDQFAAFVREKNNLLAEIESLQVELYEERKKQADTEKPKKSLFNIFS